MHAPRALALAVILPLVLGGLAVTVDPPPAPNDASASVRVHGGPHLDLVSPFNYAAIPAGTPVALAVSGSGFSAVQVAVDGGPAQPLDPPYAVSTTAWAPGMHVLHVEALDGASVAASRDFVFFVDPQATWPPDTVPVDVVLVGFPLLPEDLEGLLATAYPVARTLGGLEEAFNLTFTFDVHAASAAYHQDLLAYLQAKALYRDDVQARLNLEALRDQRDNGTLRDVFDPLEGWEIETAWAELYLRQAPPVPGLEPEGYTFTLLNLSALDDPGLGVDHWFVEDILDPDTHRTQDWWRLEWDNDLNTPMGYPLNAWGGTDHAIVVDPTAYQWYLDWTHVWWQGGNGRAPYGLQYEEVPASSRPDYLAGILNDLVAGLAATLPAPPPAEPSVVIRNYVLSGSANHSLNDLLWVSSDLALQAYLEGFLPFKSWAVETTIDLVANYTDLEAFVDGATTFVGGQGFIDGSAVFNYLFENKDQFVGDDPAVFEVLTVNLLYDNRSMLFGGQEFTGLGGSGITAIFLRTERLFDANGTRQKGLTSIIAHESGHNLGYGHQFGPNYRADFVDGNMGYFRNDLGYGQFWEDALHRLYLRTKLRDTLQTLDARGPLNMEPEFKAFYRDYRGLDFLQAYEDLLLVDAMLADTLEPTADAGPDLAVAEDLPLVLDGSGSSDDFRVLNYTWDFGDGTQATSSDPTVEHTWGDPGNYDVILTVSDAAGNLDADTMEATVLDVTPPSVMILAPSEDASVSAGEVEVRWTASDNGLGIERIELRLDGGDPVDLAGDVTAHTLTVSGAGRHVATVVAFDHAGNRDVATVSFTVGGALGTPVDLRTLGIVAAVSAGVLGAGVYLALRYRRGHPPAPPEE